MDYCVSLYFAVESTVSETTVSRVFGAASQLCGGPEFLKLGLLALAATAGHYPKHEQTFWPKPFWLKVSALWLWWRGSVGNRRAEVVKESGR